jgi:hypothetical protein
MREPVTQGFHAVYLAGEDVENTAQHVAAWCKHHNGGKVPERFRFVRDVPDLMDGEDCTALVSHLRSRLPEGARAVLVLDTWQRATSAAPDGQNSDRDMGVAVKKVEALAREFGGPVICCCHPPKHDKGTVAGSLVIENTSTAIWHLSKTDAGLEVKVIRIKGQGLGNHKYLDHKTVMLDRCDERGQRLTGLVATFVGGDWSNAADAREAENAARQAVLNTVLGLLDRGISVVRVSGGGQKPRDVAAAVKKLGHNLTARQVSDHLAALERDGKLVYVQADKNHRGKAGYQRPSVAALAAESSAESPPKAIPNGAESD